MDNRLSSLVKKGTIDTAVQVLATTGVRFALVMAVFVLAALVSAEELASYDLFVVASSIIQIVLTIGLDSGLAISAKSRERRRRGYLWYSLVIVIVTAVALYLPALFAVRISGIERVLDARQFSLAYVYAAANGVMIILFSYYRWIGSAFRASFIILAANMVGFLAAGLLFYSQGTVTAFIAGLTLGSVIGALFALGAALRWEGFDRVYFQRRFAQPAIGLLFRVGLPFGFTSGAMISRRAIDRAMLLAITTPTILGGYAVVSRAGEMAAFVFALPVLGFAPLIVAGYEKPNVRRLARLFYHGGLAIFAAIALGAAVALHFGASALFPAMSQPVVHLALALLVANLFFTETTLAGFGFVIAKKTGSVALLSIAFIAVYLAVALPLIELGFGVTSVAAGFLVASFFYSTAMIYVSERLYAFGYRMRLIVAVKALVTAAVLVQLFSVR